MDTADTGLAFRLTSLGEDEQGELYVCDRNGAVLKIVAEPPSGIDGWRMH
jgi:hypothetical protein